MSSNQIFALLIGTGYVIGLIASFFSPAFVALFFPSLLAFIGLIVYKHHSGIAKADPKPLDGTSKPSSSALSSESAGAAEASAKPSAWTIKTAASAASPANSSSSNGPIVADPLWGPVLEYIGVIEDMIISEGQKNNLDDEIVEKTLALLSRLGRVIPQLKELNDGNINHNINRLVFKDLNGAINPFLRLSGEAKQQNRRLLLSGLKDIDSKISFYVASIEQRDLIDLQTKIDLIQQRYNSKI
ncbi:hypothetical protein [Paenibacillus agricola]|uniref:5-bromo-4-chloroindolyl phosphate hydrolysis protein n=1 Tax=Paenibacillus agricola TaxID=2716264 RepID=A0ABX0J3Q4_9BACL|nr:hypothetical protein [Paenibacillus agricola]NHN29458.1 hypothetical protein [Paenibacillus agricola]